MSFFGRSQIYNSEPIEAGIVPCPRCPELEAALKDSEAIKLEQLKRITNLETLIENVKVKEIIVPAGEIDERLYDLLDDINQWYWFKSRGLSDTIRNDRFALKMEGIKNYLSNIKHKAED